MPISDSISCRSRIPAPADHRFCERYQAWRKHLDVAMWQVHRAGEKAFMDYAGPKFGVVDRKTGEVHDAMVFVGVLAANHTFVDVTRSRALL